MPEESKWTYAVDRLPRRGEHVAVLSGKNEFVATYDLSGLGHFWFLCDDERRIVYPFDRWILLPEAKPEPKARPKPQAIVAFKARVCGHAICLPSEHFGLNGKNVTVILIETPEACRATD